MIGYKTHLSSAEARERLRAFQGKSGFGSADYYERDETQRDGSGRRTSSDVIMANLGDSAQQFASTFVGQASEDLESIKRVVAYGTDKLGEIWADIQRRG